jgi:hypothetical protein
MRSEGLLCSPLPSLAPPPPLPQQEKSGRHLQAHWRDWLLPLHGTRGLPPPRLQQQGRHLQVRATTPCSTPTSARTPPCPPAPFPSPLNHACSFAMIVFQLMEGVPPFEKLGPIEAARAASDSGIRPAWGEIKDKKNAEVGEEQLGGRRSFLGCSEAEWWPMRMSQHPHLTSGVLPAL